jgi:hypothetical protein
MKMTMTPQEVVKRLIEGDAQPGFDVPPENDLPPGGPEGDLGGPEGSLGDEPEGMTVELSQAEADVLSGILRDYLEGSTPTDENPGEPSEQVPSEELELVTQILAKICPECDDGGEDLPMPAEDPSATDGGEQAVHGDPTAE